MSEQRTINIPGFSLNYEDYVLQSVGIGGELYLCERVAREENTFGYNRGFDAGREALAQQVYGIIGDKWDSDEEKLRRLRDLVNGIGKKIGQ